jgi:hypothetical protein
MACFLVPAAEAIVTTAAGKIAENKENTLTDTGSAAASKKSGMSAVLKRVSGFLWGGSALLAFEHIWHGEVTPFFPFLTAASNPSDKAMMLHEMSTIGVSMAVLVTVFAVGTSLISAHNEKRSIKSGR